MKLLIIINAGSGGMLVFVGDPEGCKMPERTMHGEQSMWEDGTILRGTHLLWHEDHY